MFGFCSLEVFMGFVKAYIQLFAYSSVTTEDWKTYLFTYFKDKVRNQLALLSLTLDGDLHVVQQVLT